MSNLTYQQKRNTILFIASALLTPHILPVLVLIVWLSALFISGMVLAAAIYHERNSIVSGLQCIGWTIRNLVCDLNPISGSFWVIGLGGQILSHIEKPISSKHYIQ